MLVAAEKRELAGVLRRCRRRERLRWPLEWAWRGELRGRPVVLAANGPGGLWAAEAMRVTCGREEVDAVVSTGWCGGLDPELAPGEIFVASGVKGEGVSFAAAVPRTGCAFRSGWLVTVDRVAQTAEEKARLRESGAAAVDMEAAAVAAESERRGLRFFCVRVVLDGAGESFRLDFNAARRDNGRFSRRRILRAALARPWVGLPELVRWGRRTREAARVLGDFLAECEFAS